MNATPDTTAALIAERENTHGDFRHVAAVAQRLRFVFRSTPGWNDLDYSACEALDMIATKIARILCGDPDHPDHWRDIAGYTELGLQELEGTKNV